jgi:uncharacterized membrane protein
METSSDRQPERFDWHPVALAVIVILAALLRLYGLDRTSIWLDEAYSWGQITLPFWEMYQASVESPHPPLQNFLAWPWVRIFGDSEAAMRALPALLGTAAIYMIYLTGRLLWNRKSGLFAAAILTVSGFHVWYSQEFRAYALLTLTSILFVYSVFRMLAHPGRGIYLFNMAAAVLLLFSHVFGSFLFAGVNLYLAIGWLLKNSRHKYNFVKWLTGQVVAMAIFGQWAIHLLEKSDDPMILWVPELDLYQFFSQLAYVFNGPPAAVVMCSIALYTLYRTFLKPEVPADPAVQMNVSNQLPDSDQRWKVELTLVWLVFPIATAMILSFLVTPLFMSRYLILVLPAMCLLVTKGLFLLGHGTSRQIWAVALLAVGLLYSTWHVHHRERDQYRHIVADVESCLRPGDLILAYPGRAIVNAQYYMRNPGIDLKPLEDSGQFSKLIAGRERVWLIEWRRQPESMEFLTDGTVESHQVVRKQTARGVSSYLLTSKDSGDSADSFCES